MSNPEDFHLKNLRGNRPAALAALRGARKYLIQRGGRVGLCEAVLRGARHLPADDRWVGPQLGALVRARLDRHSWLEKWLRDKHSRPIRLRRDGFFLTPDPELLPTRLAWIDSLIEELSK